MPNKIIDYKPQQIREHYCYQEPRITAIETRLQNKKENITEVHEDYYHLRDKIEIISENVVELTTILKEAQKKEDENDKKIDELQVEIARINSSLETLKYLIPIACTILTFIVNYLI